MFKKVLIANRGEIAVRVIRALRDMEIEAIAVYSEQDQSSMHVALADWAVKLPGKSLAETYLSVERIIEAAKCSGAEAIHPGYGFLSENPQLALQARKNGIRFIGPSAEAIGKLGDKITAKKLADQAGVPTVPGSAGAIADLDTLRSEVKRIGLPVMLKAAAGGGGRGIRVVQSESDLSDSFAQCQREAQSYFSDNRVFVEKFITNPRHIEVQIICDDHGNGVHLFERDCSVQRRNQKLIEEAPSAYLTPEGREKLGALALKLAKTAGYSGAGTVEFIGASPDELYFMEMNARIQVEHPVTEMVTGVDLVREQIRVAAGDTLSFKQENIKLRGHAIEARINAEDPETFAPAVGLVTHWQAPQGPFLRMDSHVYPGYRVPADYDSLLGKLIAWGENRPEAIARLRRGLGELLVSGVKTTARFSDAVVNHPRFRAAEISTAFFAEEEQTLKDASRLKDVSPEVASCIQTFPGV